MRLLRTGLKPNRLFFTPGFGVPGDGEPVLPELLQPIQMLSLPVIANTWARRCYRPHLRNTETEQEKLSPGTWRAAPRFDCGRL